MLREVSGVELIKKPMKRLVVRYFSRTIIALIKEVEIYIATQLKADIELFNEKINEDLLLEL